MAWVDKVASPEEKEQFLSHEAIRYLEKHVKEIYHC
jgi:hypothetical protein